MFSVSLAIKENKKDGETVSGIGSFKLEWKQFSPTCPANTDQDNCEVAASCLAVTPWIMHVCSNLKFQFCTKSQFLPSSNSPCSGYCHSLQMLIQCSQLQETKERLFETLQRTRFLL